LNCETNVSNQFKEQSTCMTVVHFRSFFIATLQPKSMDWLVIISWNFDESQSSTNSL
jgi:hypothetical protein